MKLKQCKGVREYKESAKNSSLNTLETAWSSSLSNSSILYTMSSQSPNSMAASEAIYKLI